MNFGIHLNKKKKQQIVGNHDIMLKCFYNESRWKEKQWVELWNIFKLKEQHIVEFCTTMLKCLHNESRWKEKQRQKKKEEEIMQQRNTILSWEFCLIIKNTVLSWEYCWSIILFERYNFSLLTIFLILNLFKRYNISLLKILSGQ